MKAFTILTPYNYSQTQVVIAEDMATAEKLFLTKYPNTKILKIEHFADYVIVAPSLGEKEN